MTILQYFMPTFTSLVSTGYVQRDFLREEGKGMGFHIYLVNMFLLKLGRFPEITYKKKGGSLKLPYYLPK
jgi:hypothetical protein